MSSSSNIDDVIRKWLEAKERVKILEDKIDKCKSTIGKLMDKKGVNKLEGNSYYVSRRTNVRTQINKSSMPLEIWNKYSTRCSYESYHPKEY